jgi:hypothetical protein
MLIKMSLLVGLLVGSLITPMPSQQFEPNSTAVPVASEIRPTEISLCPIIIRCIPEHFLDPKTCTCRPRP